MMDVEFEYDERKSRVNESKHGINFVAAQALWMDTEDEPGFLMIGAIEGRHWSAVITYRGERVRIISVRRSRRSEVGLYEGS